MKNETIIGKAWKCAPSACGGSVAPRVVGRVLAPCAMRLPACLLSSVRLAVQPIAPDGRWGARSLAGSVVFSCAPRVHRRFAPLWWGRFLLAARCVCAPRRGALGFKCALSEKRGNARPPRAGGPLPPALSGAC